MFNIFPPELLHIGENCYANVIFQSVVFLDFQEETMHYMKSSDTWNNGINKNFDPSVVPLTLEYNTKLLSTFPKKHSKTSSLTRNYYLRRQ